VGKIKFPHLVGGEEGDSVGAAVAFFFELKTAREAPTVKFYLYIKKKHQKLGKQ